LALSRQAELAGLARSTVYAPRRVAALDPDPEERALLELIDAEYTRRPVYGSRKITVYRRGLGYPVNRQRVQRLMGILGLAGMAPGPNTSRPHPQRQVYPYLLRGVESERPNQVWSTDITYIRLARGFVYRVAVIDGYSRNVLAWRVSNTLDSGFGVECLEQALPGYGAPELVNSDQGCQFTSEAFTEVLQVQSIAISMDGRGRAVDNLFVERLWRSVKYEDGYLKGYAEVPELLLGLTDYLVFYNTERSHPSLDYRTPDEVYRAGHGGGAQMVDNFSERETSHTEAEAISGQRRSAACDPRYPLKLDSKLS
jgi:putative transposase